jgi:hypothetical protein
MGQAKIKKQQREAAKRAASVPAQKADSNKTGGMFTPKFVENVKIDCESVIRFGKQEDRRFVGLYWDMQERFGDRDYGHQVCFHEAAHAELMEQDGIQNVRFAGPDIVYDPIRDRFIASSGIAVGDDQPNAVVDDEYIFMITCHFVAGGVALRSAGIAETGDAGDFKYFQKKFAANPPKSGEKAEAMWKRAQECVAARLTESETEKRVEARLEKYFRRLYSDG